MVTNGFEHMSADEFNAALLKHSVSGGTFVYFTGWLPDAVRRVSENDGVDELRSVVRLAMEAQLSRRVCLTQKCLREGSEREMPIYEYRATVRRLGDAGAESTGDDGAGTAAATDQTR